MQVERNARLAETIKRNERRCTKSCRDYREHHVDKPPLVRRKRAAVSLMLPAGRHEPRKAHRKTDPGGHEKYVY